ncbi:MMPL family transporter [Oxyplasma meridianum]|uniref:MMPL family transporter n=1 Tax=Oxyplasma meridianum TaxID=3073602 RepID=A0AAX4NHG9_9ARCH
MNFPKWLIKHSKAVIIIWIVATLASVPAVMSYSHYLSYSNSVSTSSNSESQRAQNILSSQFPQNQSLTVVVNENPFMKGIGAKTISLQEKLLNSGIKNLTSTTSPFTQYATLINDEIGGHRSAVISLYNGFNSSAFQVYSFPSAFMKNFSSNLTVWKVAEKSGYNGSAYEKGFLSSFNNTSSSSPIQSRVQTSIVDSTDINLLKNNQLFYSAVLNYTNVSQYPQGIINSSASFISSYIGYNISSQLLNAIIQKGNTGINYVDMYGLMGAPSFITSQYVSPDNSTFLISLVFNVKSGYIGPNDFYPAEVATPNITTITHSYFGNNANVTGNGAISYQSKQLSSSSGAFFGFIFVALAIAVFITLVSYRSAIINLIFVSIATLLGYVSIFITGILVSHVNYVVNYTLTAVLLGVATDYFVFIVARYRQERREGRTHEEALETASTRSRRSVIISGITVAASLATFSFVPGYRTWGTVLFTAIMLTLLLVSTLLPSVLSIFGKNLFMKRGMKPLKENYHKDSMFYKASGISTKHKFAVAAVIVLVAAPAMYFFFTLPTTYNFETGLPSTVSSVSALNEINSKFGANILYPVYVIVPLHNSSLQSVSDKSTLQNLSKSLLSMKGAEKVVGPYSTGTSFSASANYSSYITDNGKYAYFSVYTSYDPYTPAAINFVSHLRDNSSLIVGGLTSGVIDERNQSNHTYLELAVLIVAVIAVILFISFRSIKYPIISLSGVFFSISWTTAILYVISHYLLHEALIYLIPIILFVILMSLGNDYSVFIISRIRENQGKYQHDEAIGRGMVGSGKVVTSLGLILAVSLGSLALIPVGFLQQLGIAFVISLIIDTFVVRTFYFPAMIAILRPGIKKSSGR